MGFADFNSCLTVCNYMGYAVLPGVYNFAGYIGNSTGNTMACRLYHALIANSTGNATECPAASIHGGGVCGTSSLTDQCGTYCTIQGGACAETSQIQGSAFNGTYCGIQCAYVYNFPSNNTFPVATSGDTIQCRLYHSAVASVLRNVSSGYTHCAHASPLGGGASGCSAPGSAIKYFCAQTLADCQGSYSHYSSAAQCASDAAQYDATDIGTQFGFVNATGGDTLGCRFYHGGLPSVVLPGTHCAHTGWSTGGVCGNKPSTAAPTTAAPTTATGTGSSATSVVMSVFVVLAALLIALF